MKFEAFEIALALIRALRPLVAKIRKFDPDLSRQLRKAGTSVANNVAEGNRRTGRDRNHHFDIAAGSAEEIESSLRVAVAWGYLEEDEIKTPLDLEDREQAMLFRLRGGRRRR